MSSIDIIVLGTLLEKPQNAYLINKTLSTSHVREWLKISEPAVYRNIRMLKEKGYLIEQKEKIGNRPVKKIFTITDAGRKHFDDLLIAAADSPVRIESTFDTWISHLNHLPREKAISLLAELKEHVIQRQIEVSGIFAAKGNELPLATRSILDLQIRMLKLVSDWAADLYDYYTGVQIPHFG